MSVAVGSITQVCVYLEFSFSELPYKWLAFKNMGRKNPIFKEAAGLQFIKLLGCGAGNGFSAIPDFGRYALLAVFQNRIYADKAMAADHVIAEYLQTCAASMQVTMQPLKSHGQWGSGNPFQAHDNYIADSPIAVITRATIRPVRLLEFWMNVPKTSQYMAGHPAAIYQAGIGEYPIFMQATFSIWKSRAALYKAAYSDEQHGKIIKKTRIRNWYSEELFAQFRILEVQTTGTRYKTVAEKLTQL